MKVLFIDENILLGKSLEMALDTHDIITEFKFISTTRGLPYVMTHFQPDIVLLESYLSSCDAMLLGKKLIGTFKVKLVFLSRRQYLSTQMTALNMGANGYLSKELNLDQLGEKLVKVYHQNQYFFPHIAESIYMTPREKELLELLAKGYQQQEIADNLGVSVRTVRNHIYSINSKFETSSVLHSVVKAIKLNMIDIY